MLKTVTVQPTQTLDVGRMAEAMVYFPRTRWVTPLSGFGGLVRAIGWSRLHDLLDLGDIDFVVDDSTIHALLKDDMISVAGIRSAASPSGIEFADIEQALEFYIRRNVGITKASKLEVDRLIPRLNLAEAYVNDWEGSEVDMADDLLVFSVARRIAIEKGWPVGTYLRFRPTDYPGGLKGWRVETDFLAHTEWSMMEIARVAGAIFAMRAEVKRSAHGQTDLWLQSDCSAALWAKMAHLAERAADNQGHIKYFEDQVFQKRSIARAVSSGERSLDDVLKFLQHPNTRKWKSWLAEQKADGALIRDYDAAALAPRKMFAGISSKPARLIVEASANAALAIVTQGASLPLQAAIAAAQPLATHAADQVLQSWRPIQWAEKTARPFVGVSSDPSTTRAN